MEDYVGLPSLEIDQEGLMPVYLVTPKHVDGSSEMETFLSAHDQRRVSQFESLRKRDQSALPMQR